MLRLALDVCEYEHRPGPWWSMVMRGSENTGEQHWWLLSDEKWAHMTIEGDIDA
jgi:hypothetical protein